jgi:hypothetical protein
MNRMPTKPGRGPFRTPEFRSLKKEWYGKLAEAGFEDTEFHAGSVTSPKREGSHSKDREHMRFGERSGSVEYYRMAARWGHVNVFPSRVHRWMWQLHAEGRSSYQVAAAVGPARGRQPRIVKARLRDERVGMARYFATGADEDTVAPTLFEEHIAAEGGFAHVTNLGEGGAGRAARTT